MVEAMTRKKILTCARGSPTRRKKKSKEKPTKIELLRGHIEVRYVKCGRANCKCAKGELHGPYHLLRWKSAGRKITRYVKKGEEQAVFATVSAYRRKKVEQRQQRDSYMELGREIRENNKRVRLILQLIRKGAIQL
jgi:hypothetical protein